MIIRWNRHYAAKTPHSALLAFQPLALRSYLAKGSGAAALTNYMALVNDTNTAMLLYLRITYYSVPAQQDLAPLLAKWLQEGTPNDSTRQWAKLQRRIRGDAT